MPEFPDIETYLHCLRPRIQGEVVEAVRIMGPNLVKTVAPRPAEAAGRRVTGLRRLGKRIVIGLEDQWFLVLHLMIAGRLHWRDAGAGAAGRQVQARFDFASGSLILTEAGTRRRASLHLVVGEPALAELDPGGAEVAACDAARFAEILRRGNHTLKRALTDPRRFSGIGNAYSDEILHRARLSPVALATSLSDAEVARLQAACVAVLEAWTARLRDEAGDGFPEKVTAFRPQMAVHGRFRQPCPDCGAPVQRIVYASNETNYCAACQTGGRILADRSLSRLLKKDWPRTLEELELLSAKSSR